MNIDRAIITAAAPDQSTLPLQRLVDRNGQEKTALQLIIEEVLDAQIDNICIVICPGMKQSYEQAAGPHSERLKFVEQDQPRGYGDALYRARDFVGDRPFLHLVSDHLYLSSTEQGCARQLVELASAENCSVSAVQATREVKLPYFGAIGGTRVPKTSRFYEVSRVVEKPTPTQAEQELVIAGLRSGYYQCLFGMHVLQPGIMGILESALSEMSDGSKVSLSPALSVMASRERYLAMELEGARYNIGIRYGLLIAQMAIALSGQDRDQILTELVELLATRS